MMVSIDVYFNEEAMVEHADDLLTNVEEELKRARDSGIVDGFSIRKQVGM